MKDGMEFKKNRGRMAGRAWLFLFCILAACRPWHCLAAENSSGQVEGAQADPQNILKQLGLPDVDAYLSSEELSDITFSGLVYELMQHGAVLDFSGLGKRLWDVLTSDYAQNKSVLIQILVLAIACSVLLQISAAMEKGGISDICFLGIYLILVLLLLKLFMTMTAVVDGFFGRLVDFMQVVQPVFVLSMVFSTGSVTAGAYYELLLLLIYIVDIVFGRILLPLVQLRFLLMLVNDMMKEPHFTKIAGLMSEAVSWGIKLALTAVLGLNVVQGLLAPGIDGVRRSALAGMVQAVPGAGQVMNAVTEVLAGSAVLIKNSVGVAALAVLAGICFAPLAKLSCFTLLYKGCAALAEPVADKRISGAVSSLGQAAQLYLKLMFYGVLLLFLTIAIICVATSVH